MTTWITLRPVRTASRSYEAGATIDLTTLTSAEAAEALAAGAIVKVSAITATLGASATRDVGTTAGTVAAGDDTRMTDSRTPTAHAATHASGQPDAVSIASTQVTGLGTAAAAATADFLAAPVASGTLTLAAGTATLADAHVTADTVVRLAYKTCGGVPGAVFVSARTAGVSLVVTSTSGADTSVVHYEVVSW